MTGKAGQAKAVFFQAGRPDHPFDGQIMNGVQPDKIGNGFLIFQFGGDKFSFG